MWGPTPTIMKIWERGHRVRVPALFSEGAFNERHEAVA
jgi:hypothetical protein